MVSCQQMPRVVLFVLSNPIESGQSYVKLLLKPKDSTLSEYDFHEMTHEKAESTNAAPAIAVLIQR
jgi:hypothetical protein